MRPATLSLSFKQRIWLIPLVAILAFLVGVGSQMSLGVQNGQLKRGEGPNGGSLYSIGVKQKPIDWSLIMPPTGM